MKPREALYPELGLNPKQLKLLINEVAAQTGFAPSLIEKDYFCTLVLQHMAAGDDKLVFKGGTCLAKVYAGFYRLSEDLDFVIPMPVEATRSERSKKMTAAKSTVLGLVNASDALLTVASPLTGANDCRQYIALVEYGSLFESRPGNIKVEIGLREPLYRGVSREDASTLLFHPVDKKPLLKNVQVSCVSFEEAMAEKVRAALTRREVAARDFYDIDYAVRSLGFNPKEDGFIDLVRTKLIIPGNGNIDVSEGRLTQLGLQLDRQLKSVLRPEDFKAFDIGRATAVVVDIATALSTLPSPAEDDVDTPAP